MSNFVKSGEEGSSPVGGVGSEAPPYVTLDRIGVRYRIGNSLWRRSYQWSLRDISFSLRQGETLGVIGRNGAGKSTLMRVLAGVIEPDCGTISAGDTRALLLSLRLGFQPNLSGRENVFQSGLLLGMTLQQVRGSLDAIAEFADIGEHFDRPVRTYSAGMGARLGFAVAMQAQPDVLLIDEVLGVGDKDFRVKSRQFLRQRIQSNQTVVLASHADGTIRDLCDRVIWIERGELRAVGDTSEVLKQYLNDSPN